MKSAIERFTLISGDEKRVYSLIQKKGPVTKNKILDISGLTLTTLNRIIAALKEDKLVLESGLGESSGGRRPSLFDVNPDGFYVIGIDISRTYTRIVVSNPKMSILFKQQFTMDGTCSPDKTVELAAAAVRKAMVRLGISSGEVLGVGLGTVGPLDLSAGTITNPVNFPAPGWKDVSVKKMLAEILGLPVFIDNGANTAVLAEFLYGAGKSYKSVAYFNCGMGIRTGAISSGTIVRPVSDAEDAFAHMTIDVDGELCTCGNRGCIECYCTAVSITQKFLASLEKGRTTLISKPVPEINYIDICRAASDGDPLSYEIIEKAAAVFGSGLANYINLLNPGLVILSGPLISHSALFFSASRDIALKRHYIKENNGVVFIKKGTFGDSAISLGAASLVVEHYLKSPILALEP